MNDNKLSKIILFYISLDARCAIMRFQITAILNIFISFLNQILDSFRMINDVFVKTRIHCNHRLTFLSVQKCSKTIVRVSIIVLVHGKSLSWPISCRKFVAIIP